MYLLKSIGAKGISISTKGRLLSTIVIISLFALFGDGQTPIGVSLTSSCLMIPAKSISGIYFPTEVPFFSCQLCDRKDCPGRKAVYDPKVAAEFGES